MFLRPLAFLLAVFSWVASAEVFPQFNATSFSVVVDGTEAQRLFESMQVEPLAIPGFPSEDQRKKILVASPSGVRQLALECYYIRSQSFFSCMLLFDKDNSVVATEWSEPDRFAQLQSRGHHYAEQLARNFYVQNTGLIFESDDSSLKIFTELDRLNKVQSFQIIYSN